MNRNGYFKNALQAEAAQKGQEQKGGSYIGKVVNYHGVTGTKDEPGECDCDRHKGKKMKMSERHSVDVDVLIENKVQRWNAVPCLMFAQGIIDKGFVKNDRVFITFLNGDNQMPVAIAYYREPNGLTIFWQNLKHRVGNYVLDMLPGLDKLKEDVNKNVDTSTNTSANSNNNTNSNNTNSGSASSSTSSSTNSNSNPRTNSGNSNPRTNTSSSNPRSN